MTDRGELPDLQDESMRQLYRAATDFVTHFMACKNAPPGAVDMFWAGAEWRRLQSETREDGPHCGTCQCLETDGAFPPAATEHQHEWVPSSTPGQETCVSCHCYRPAVKTTERQDDDPHSDLPVELNP